MTPDHVSQGPSTPPPATGSDLQEQSLSQHRSGHSSRKTVSRRAIAYAASSELLASRLQAPRDDDDPRRTSQQVKTAVSGPILSGDMATERSLPGAVPLEDMQSLVSAYLEFVHPVYTFIDSAAISKTVAARHSLHSMASLQDGIIFGVSALGALFGDGIDRTQDSRHLVLAESAQRRIDANSMGFVNPSFNMIAALVLRTMYLRATGQPYATWITSCTTMHTIALTDADTMDLARNVTDDALCFNSRQTLWIARLLNTWIANEHARPYVNTHFDLLVTPQMPQDPATATPHDQMAYLYHVGKVFSPDYEGSPEEYEASISQLAAIDAQQSHGGVLSSVTIMALCIYRLLRSSDSADLDQKTFACLIKIGHDGLEAAERLARQQKPWWHLANVPFQLLCAMLVIDTRSSFAQIPATMQAFEGIANALPSSAITKALKSGRNLIELTRKQKAQQLQSLDQCHRALEENTSSHQLRAARVEDFQVQLHDREAPSPCDLFEMGALAEFNSLDWNFWADMDIPVFESTV